MTTFILLDERLCAALIGVFTSAGHEMIACVNQPERGIRFRVALDRRETQRLAWVIPEVEIAIDGQ